LDGNEFEMLPQTGGWFEHVTGAAAGSRYAFLVGDRAVPDPASSFQPDGVHEPSEVIDPSAYRWCDSGWHGRTWEETVLYELHVGTFTPEGTFRSAAGRLDDLHALGVTAVELMPVAQAAGGRNWGYDGVDLFAPANAYGRPDDLRAFVDAAHAREMSVFLDVVYNHFGPDGNYLHTYAPEFFTDRYRTPWGSAIDLDGPHSTTVRDFFIENALYWLEDFHMDGLRLDAVHALHDDSSRHFLDELAIEVRRHAPPDRLVHLVLENDDNAAHFLEHCRSAWYDAQWNDDAHHALHVALTGERDRYYRDYPEPVRSLGRVLSEGFAYQGEHSEHRNRPRGESSVALAPTAFVDFLQNHDQVGNRAFGERITALAPWPAVRAAAAIVLLAPSIPLLFMGEEWGASSPFLFFCDFAGELAAAVTSGRRAGFDSSLREQVPDPNARATFERSKLEWEERSRSPHAEILAWYTRALAARKEHVTPLLREQREERIPPSAAFLSARAFRLTWEFERSVLALIANLGDASVAAPPLEEMTVVFSTEALVGSAQPATLAPWSVLWLKGRRP
jgi:malto-oligosyltrehalose trehalohydrolase